MIEAVPSVHDVTPSTLEQTLRLVDLLDGTDLEAPDLLVVPGAPWDSSSLDVIRGLRDAGCELVAHGWDHRCLGSRTLYHRVHGWVISRDKAEHLSYDRRTLVQRVRSSFDWFGEVGLPAPTLYVPPAWALGALRRADLRNLPFVAYERLDGYVDGHTGRVLRAPLVGFETDTRWRQAGVSVTNRVSVLAARLLRRPLRVSLHPHDLDLLLAGDLRRMVRRRWSRRSVSEVLQLTGVDGAAESLDGATES